MARYDEIADSVESRFDASSVYASEAWTITQAWINALGDLLPPGYELDNLDVEWEDLNVSIGSAVAPERPDPELVIPPEPPLPEYVPVDDIDPVTIPVFDIPDPSYNEPDFPDDEMPDVPTDIPPISAVVIPTRPEYTLPDEVDLGPDITVDPPPDVTLPTFDVDAPEMDVIAPGNAFVYSEGPYSSTLLDAAKAWLEAQLGSGSTGLDATVYQAMIDRAEARQALKHAAKYDEAEQYFGGRHHTLPTGALSGRLLNIQEQIGQEEQQLSDDTLIEEGRLAQTNTHFVVQQSLAYEAMAMDHFNKVAQRAFEVARAVQMAAMEVFNAQVARYNAQLEGYKTQATVYEIRLRAAGLRLEQYKVYLQGKELQGRMRELLLNQYNLQLEGIKTLYSLYATEMQAAKLQSDVNSSIIEAYRTRISAFSTAIGAITAKYNAYQAQLSGEQTKADLYKSQVQAYGIRVDAIGKGAQVNIEQVKAQLDVNRLEIAEYTALLEAFKTRIEASATEVQAELQAYTAEVGGYSEEVKALAIEANAEIEAYKAKSSHETNIVNMGIKRADTAMDHAAKIYGLLIEQYKSGASIGAQITASALSAVSASASYGYSEGVNTGYSYDQTKSDPEFSFITML